MLVLISFVLVLVATGLLVVGLLQDDGLTLVYLSIACSIAAGVILAVAVRVARPKASTAAGPAPLEGGAQATTPAPVAPVVAHSSLATQTSEPVSAEPVTATIPAVVTAEELEEEQSVASDEEGDDEGTAKRAPATRTPTRRR